MNNTVNYLFPFQIPPDPVDGGGQADVSVMLNRHKSFPFQFVFELRKNTFNWVQVRGIDWSKDVLETQLLNPLHHSITMMDSEIIHHNAYVIKKPPCSKLVKVDFEFFNVNRFIEGHHKINTSLH